MQSVDISGLYDLDSRFQNLLSELPDMRREMHESAGAAVRDAVHAEIVASGIYDSHGKIRGWQELYIGSYGGYAAVRAVKGGVAGKNPGAITNYLESGHRVRQPSGKAKQVRKSRAKQQRVKAYGFYRTSRGPAQNIAMTAANKFADKVAGKLGD